MSIGLDLLNQFGVADTSYDLTPDQLVEKIKHADALIVRSATKVQITLQLLLLNAPVQQLHDIWHSFIWHTVAQYKLSISTAGDTDRPVQQFHHLWCSVHAV